MGNFCYFVVLNLGLNKLLSDNGREFYLFLKYNFFNVFKSRIFYVFLDRYLFLSFLSGISVIYLDYPKRDFYLHLGKYICGQFFMFIYLINSSISIYSLLYRLKIVYIITNRFLLFRGNSLLLL